MATTTTTTNKPLNPRAQDLSPKGYNRAALFSGKALSFDGVNDRIELNTLVGTFSDITACWMVKTSSAAAFQSIIADGNSYFDAYITSAGQFRIWFGAGYETTNLPKLNNGNWNFLVMTREGSVGKIYVNGKLCETITYPTANITINADAMIGSNFTSDYYNGLMSGVRVLNVALTAAQVADLYLNPEKITPDGVATSALKLWLPMMEGAGASAYDGSGNGNDGTINGATWTAGVGSPVAQTALVSWNKGTNRLLYSEALNDAAWQKANATITSNAATAPNGTTTADQITSTSTSIENYTRQDAGVGISAGTTLTTMAYAKKGTHTFFRMRNLFVNNGGDFGNAWFNLDTGAVATIQSGQTATMTAVGDGWYLCTLTGAIGTTNAPLLIDLGTATTNGSNVPTTNGSTFVWGASNYVGAVGAPYIKTNATAQTSAVLVPEGLTAGASIFGTDIITPRNAFALNLDGVSYASVNDNASVDLTTGATLEAWVLIPNVPAVIDSGIISKYTSSGSFLLSYRASGVQLGFAAYFHGGGVLVSSYAINFVPSYGSWVHVVGTFTGSTAITTYVNGVQASQNTSGIPASITQSALNVELGRWGSTSNGNLRVANPRIYNRALTAAEVLRNYNADKAKFGL